MTQTLGRYRPAYLSGRWLVLLVGLIGCVEEVVTVVSVDEVLVTPSRIEVAEGGEVRVAVEIRSHQWGRLEDRGVIWTVNPSSLGSVEGDRFLAERAGAGQVEARVEGVAGEVTAQISPLAPEEVRARRRSDGTVDLRWGFRGSGGDGFRVQRATQEGVNWAERTTVPRTSLGWVDAQASRTEGFRYRVLACQGGDNCSAPSVPAEVGRLFQLSVTKSGQGTLGSSPGEIAIGVSGTSGSAMFEEDSTVQLIATPATGWRVGSWGGACSGAATTCTVTMSQDRSVSVNFVQSSAPPSSGTLGAGFGTDQFAMIPTGTFRMGSNNGDSDERPIHTVAITRPFLMQRTEVTQGQWREIMGSNPSHFSSCGDTCPVERVSWNDIQTFLQRLNQRFPGRNYRLPTEAEWEYAARAGTTGDYGGTGNLNDMGWYWSNSGSRTHPVARKQPNAWGLYDMHGNVWEWVQDWFGPYTANAKTNPTGPTTGSSRVYRGGSWHLNASNARSANRTFFTPSHRGTSLGFRVARSP